MSALHYCVVRRLREDRQAASPSVRCVLSLLRVDLRTPDVLAKTLCGLKMGREHVHDVHPRDVVEIELARPTCQTCVDLLSAREQGA